MAEDIVRSDVEDLMVMVVVAGDRVSTMGLDPSTTKPLSRDMITCHRSHTQITLPSP